MAAQYMQLFHNTSMTNEDKKSGYFQINTDPSPGGEQAAQKGTEKELSNQGTPGKNAQALLKALPNFGQSEVKMSS